LRLISQSIYMNKKELLLNAALKLFVQNGFHGTATAKIAKEAGVANGTLFQYFKTKEDLVIALFVHIKEEILEYMAVNTTAKKGTKEEIKSQFISTIVWGLDNAAKFHFIQQFYASPYMNQINQTDLEKYIKPHYILIEKGINENIIKSLPTEFLYTLISNQAFGLHQFLITKKLSKIKQQETIQLTFEMLWEMISQK
jgi:AcrR family transcriptional regulator